MPSLRLAILAVLMTIPVHGAERPNVLFIAADDLRAELGCYGSNQVRSPNIDRLAALGTLFNRAYCQQAVCNPSRASLMTGLYPHTLQLWDLPTHFRERRPDVLTLPQHFKNHGYFTQNIGKIFHNWRQDNHKGDPASWSTPAVMHYARHGDDIAEVVGDRPPNLAKTPKCEILDVPDEAYYDGRVANLAIEALRKLKKKSEPFFLAVGFWKPHAHFNAPKKYWDLYDREKITSAVNQTPPIGAPELALHDGREICRDFKNRPDSKPNHADAIALRHGYYAATSYMDAQVGKVIETLNQLGLQESTIIVFWSDHGFHLGENSLWAKTSNYELDARVPMIITTPDHTAGQRTDSLVELLDLYPTLADLCGLPLPDHLEGKSLRSILENPTSIVKDLALTWHPRPAYPSIQDGPQAMGYSIRTRQHRYTEWRRFEGDQEILARELYHHRTDPDETLNRAVDSKSLSLIEGLQEKLQRAYRLQ